MLCRTLVVVMLAAWELSGQVCRLSVAGVNRARRVTGPISAECPDPLHSAPFGNWGVTSNFGSKRDGHQFNGWCHDTRVCDNSGNCRTECRDGWYEWNSCTTHPLYQAPNCTLYNDAGCTAQASTQDVNVLGTQTVDIAVGCPVVNGGVFERGGCADVPNFTRSGNFMSVYELDPITGDELIQSLYYPSILTPLRCTVWGCPIAGGDWVDPERWESPVEPRKVFAQMAMVVNSGAFLDSGNVCRIPVLPLQVVSSANFRGGELTPESIATIFSGDVTIDSESAITQPLPAVLSGIQVRVADSGGQVRNAGLVFASPRQINFVLPSGLSDGSATIQVLAGSSVRASGAVRIARFQPGLYSADASGRGLAAAAAVRVAPDGGQTVIHSQPFDRGQPTDQLVLVLFGTGIRGVSALSNVRVTIGGLAATVQYAGAQASFAGLDQINVLVPGSLAGRGVFDVQLFADGKASNVVQVSFR